MIWIAWTIWSVWSVWIIDYIWIIYFVQFMQLINFIYLPLSTYHLPSTTYNPHLPFHSLITFGSAASPSILLVSLAINYVLWLQSLSSSSQSCGWFGFRDDTFLGSATIANPSETEDKSWAKKIEAKSQSRSCFERDKT